MLGRCDRRPCAAACAKAGASALPFLRDRWRSPPTGRWTYARAELRRRVPRDGSMLVGSRSGLESWGCLARRAGNDERTGLGPEVASSDTQYIARLDPAHRRKAGKGVAGLAGQALVEADGAGLAIGRFQA